MTQSIEIQTLNLSGTKSILDCWYNGEYLVFFIKYLQDHTFIKSKNIVKDYFKERGIPADLFNEYLRRFLNRQTRYIKIALNMGYIEFYNNVTYRHTEKVWSPRPLEKELEKVKFKQVYKKK